MVKLCQPGIAFHASENAPAAPAAYLRGMAETDVAFLESLCDRFVMAQCATGLSKSRFAARVGLTPQQFTNISTYRNPPSHEAIRNAIREFGFTADWFYLGIRVGFRAPDLADRLREIEAGQLQEQ